MLRKYSLQYFVTVNIFIALNSLSPMAIEIQRIIRKIHKFMYSTLGSALQASKA